MYVLKQEAERYETVETLAEGAMGKVRLARDRLLGRLVAIKTVRLEAISDPREKARFRESLLHEAEVTRALSHPNIVDIHEVLGDGEGETPSLVMDYVPGSTLAELLMGHKADPRSDLYSMGVLLFEMLTGRSPFRGTTAAEVTQEIAQGSMDLSEITLQGMPDDLREVLLRLLKRDPQERFQNAREVLNALAGPTSCPILSDETVATQDLTELVVPELPEIGQAFGEPDNEAVIQVAPPSADNRSERVHGASREAIPWMRYALVGAISAVLTLSIGWIAFLLLDPGNEERSFDSEAHQHRMQYLPLLKEGQRLLRAGEPAVAARVFRRAEDLAPGAVAISRQRRAAEQEALAVEKHLKIQEQVQNLIDQGWSAIHASHTGRAAQLATAALVLDPENLEATAVLNAAKTSPRRQQPSKEPKPVEVAQQPEAIDRQPTVKFPTANTSAITPAPRPSTPIPPSVASTGISNLQIDIFSYLPKGVVTIYSDENQILLQPFRFTRKAGFVHRKKSAGRLERSVDLPAGISEFRIYVSAEGFETQIVNLTAQLVGGENRVLRLIIAENGTPSAQLN